MVEPEDDPTRLARDAFLAAYERDLRAGRLRSLEDYQREFRGHEEAVAEEWGWLEPTGEQAAGEVGPGSRDALVGPYRVIEQLGRGAQAIVYLAEHTALKRRVALKVLRTSLLGDGGQAHRRFRREAEVTASIDHPGICNVYETGSSDGLTWIAMQFVAGETLAARLTAWREARGKQELAGTLSLPQQDEDSEALRGSGSGRDNVGRVLAFVEQVARALHAAHERGLVHRDVKPGNLMVRDDGRPVVLDFGLAYDSEGSLILTGSTDQLGTPYYMAPEQLLERGEVVDRRADVWALGVTLYECLTAQRPFDGATREQLYRSILTEEPQPLRAVASQLPRDLEVVLQTALDKDRDRRYQTAHALAEDLRRIVMHEPIQARRISTAGRFVRWVRRSPGVAASLGLALLALVGGLVISLWFWWEASATNEQLASRVYAADMRAAAVLVDESRPQDALVRLGALEERRRGVEWRWLHARARSLAPSPWPAAPQRAGDYWLSSDRRLAIRSLVDFAALSRFRPPGIYEPPMELSVYEMPTADDEPARELWTVTTKLCASVLDPLGERLLTCTPRGHLSMLDARTGKLLAEQELGGEIRVLVDTRTIRPMAFTDDGHVLVGDRNGRIRCFDARTLAPLSDLEIRGERLSAITVLAVDPSGGGLAIGDTAGRLRYRPWTNDREPWQNSLQGRRPGQNTVCTAAFDPSGERLLFGGQGGRVLLLETARGRKLQQLERHTDMRVANHLSIGARFSRDGQFAITNGSGDARLYDATSWRLIARLPSAVRGGPRTRMLADFDAASDAILTMGEVDRGGQRWSLGALQRPLVLARNRAGIDHVISPDGRHAYTVGYPGLCKWDLQTGALVYARLHQDAAPLWSIAVSGDGTRLVVGRTDQALFCVDAEDGRVLHGFEPRSDQQVRAAPGFAPLRPHQLALDATGERLVVAFGTYNVNRDMSRALPLRVYDLGDTGFRLRREWPGHAGSVANLAIRADGAEVASVGHDARVMLWDVDTGERRWQRKLRSGSIAFSPRTGEVVVGDWGGEVQFLDPASGRRLRGWQTHAQFVAYVGFTADSGRLVTVGINGALRIWDPDTEELLLTKTVGQDWWRVRRATVSSTGDRAVIQTDSPASLFVLGSADRERASACGRNQRAVALVENLLTQGCSHDQVRDRVRADLGDQPELRQAALNVVDALIGESDDAMRMRFSNLLAAGEVAEAMAIARAVEADPVGGPLHAARTYYYRFGRDGEARRIFEQQYDADSGDQTALEYLTHERARRFDLDAFEESASELMRRELRNSTLLTMANSFGRIGRLDDAAAALDRIPGNSVLGQFGRGLLRMRYGRHEDAERCFVKARELANGTREVEVIWNRSRNALLRGDVRLALQYGRGAVILERRSLSRRAFPHLVLGRALFAAGKLEESLAEFAIAWSRFPTPTESSDLIDYARALAANGELDRARSMLAEHTDRRFPTRPFAWRLRAWWLATHEGLTEQDRLKAVVCARRAVELSNRNSPRILATLAEALFRAGGEPRRQEAVRVAEEALRIMAGRAVGYLPVEELERRLDRYRRAR